METNKKYSLSQLASIYCVYKDLSVSHIINCCTCGKSIYIRQVEDCFSLWGHFIPRSHNRNLIYHPKNSHAQCVNCNVYRNDKDTYNKYENYMIYRYGKDIVSKLLSYNKNYSEEKYLKFYIDELVKLSQIFSELIDIVIDKNTGEILHNFLIENSIKKQFYTCSSTYRQDLDTICRTLETEYIEYERL